MSGDSPTSPSSASAPLPASSIDDLMQQATDALTRMHYLRGEALCVRALAQAREQQRWDEYARILLPLQECRRQRRLIAAEGVIRLGTRDGKTPLSDVLAELGPAGCLVMTAPFSHDDAGALQTMARQAARHVEVLFAEIEDDGTTNLPGPVWRVAAADTSGVSAAPARLAAPADGLCDAWLTSQEETRKPHRQGAAWFLAACEAVGDAVRGCIRLDQAPLARVEQLEAGLAAVTDHELLHQQLFETVAALAGPSRTGSGPDLAGQPMEKRPTARDGARNGAQGGA